MDEVLKWQGENKVIGEENQTSSKPRKEVRWTETSRRGAQKRLHESADQTYRTHDALSHSDPS